MVSFLKSIGDKTHEWWKIFRTWNTSFRYRGTPVCWCNHNASPVTGMGCLDTDGHWGASYNNWNCFVCNTEVKGGENKMILILAVFLIIFGCILFLPIPTNISIGPLALLKLIGVIILLVGVFILFIELGWINVGG